MSTLAIYVVRDALTDKYERAGAIYGRVRAHGITFEHADSELRSLHAQGQAIRRWANDEWEYAAVIG